MKSPFASSHLFRRVIFVFLCLLLLTAGDRDVRAQKNPKPEDIVEKTILAYGGRPALYVIQRNGILRALVKLITPEGAREGKSALKFIRKQKMNEDLLMIELELAETKYQIGFDGKDMWSIHDGEIQKPSPAEVKAFRSAHDHSYEALLRYKENNSKLEYVGSKNLGTFDLDIIDLISPEGTRTRYEISSSTRRILYLSYEDKQESKAEPVSYRINFKDFKPVQNTLVPYVSLVFQNGKLVEERKIVEAVFNVQLEEKAFKVENANKPAEPAPGIQR
ncbi:MAG: hypothetical protein L0226_07405 [Acidobacteria bacterium]|nr:hypothetical protein [Acidobacteriota bacterium]